MRDWVPLIILASKLIKHMSLTSAQCLRSRFDEIRRQFSHFSLSQWWPDWAFNILRWKLLEVQVSFESFYLWKFDDVGKLLKFATMTNDGLIIDLELQKIEILTVKDSQFGPFDLEKNYQTELKTNFWTSSFCVFKNPLNWFEINRRLYREQVLSMWRYDIHSHLWMYLRLRFVANPVDPRLSFATLRFIIVS